LPPPTGPSPSEKEKDAKGDYRSDDPDRLHSTRTGFDRHLAIPFIEPEVDTMAVVANSGRKRPLRWKQMVT
jgi:hypothetical protein